MNRLRSLVCSVALIAVIAAACGDDERAQPTQMTPAPVQQQDAQPVAASTTEESQQAESDPQDTQSRDAQEQSQPTTQQQIQQSQRDGATDREEDQTDGQPEQASQDESAPQEELSALVLTAQPILNGYQFQQPIEMLPLPDGSFLVAEQRGYITRFVEDGTEVEQFGILDLTESVRFGGEQGLLSIALHPDHENDPYLYVYYSPREANLTRLSRFRIVQGAALPVSELVIIEVRQPYPNHNGGAVRFGPDGMLYLGIGDGGAANDPHGHGQNRETLLGAIIRIDVNGIDTSTPYRIPTDNPFLGIAGVRPEIWAYGLRNPWRMAFDRETGELWVGDVGQDRWEEIAIVGAGENHGWNVFEGLECFRSQDDCDALTEAVAPIATYGHEDGCSVTGGEVYRGKAMPALDGHYVFGDYCSSNIWTISPQGVVEHRLTADGRIASFAVDNDGEIHVLTFNGPIFKLVKE